VKTTHGDANLVAASSLGDLAAPKKFSSSPLLIFFCKKKKKALWNDFLQHDDGDFLTSNVLLD
jgi:hypothetical protein